MIEPCQYCASERVAAVLDKRIEAAPTAGNKYRKRCLGCSRWLPCCSAADFQTADIQHVLPRDADRDGDDPTVPVADFDGDVEGVKTAGDVRDDTPTAMTDGGTDQDEEEEDDQDANLFECPSCGQQVVGYPEKCPHGDCGVPYRWDNDNEDN